MSLNVENIKKITFDNLENNEVIIAVNEKINKRAKNGYFYLNDEYCENEKSPEIESFIRYYENKGFKVSTDYNDICEVVIFEISW